MPEDDGLISKLSEMSAAELLEAVGAAASQRIEQEKKQLAADAVRDYVRNGNIGSLGEDHPLNAAALELERQREAKEQNNE